LQQQFRFLIHAAVFPESQLALPFVSSSTLILDRSSCGAKLRTGRFRESSHPETPIDIQNPRLTKLKRGWRNPDFGDRPAAAANSLGFFSPAGLSPGLPDFCGAFVDFRLRGIADRLVADFGGLMGAGQIACDDCGHVVFPCGLIL
jgi:hypothetical protein